MYMHVNIYIYIYNRYNPTIAFSWENDHQQVELLFGRPYVPLTCIYKVKNLYFDIHI